MIQTEKTPILEEDIWCTNPGSGDLIEPDDTKKGIGWNYGEIPKHSTFNWSGNLVTEYLGHTNLCGIPEWDANTSYPKNAYVLGWADSGHSDKYIFISVESNSNEEPYSSSKWRQYSNTLESLLDVNFQNKSPNNLIIFNDNSDLIENPSYSDEPIIQEWVNILQSNYLSLNDLNNVYVPVQFPQDGSFLTSIYMIQDGTNTSLTWTPALYANILPFLELSNFGDVNLSNPLEYGRVLGWEDTFWKDLDFSQSGIYVEVSWDDVFYKPTAFNPPESSEYTFGGIRYKFNNIDQVSIYTTNLPKPNRPRNLTVTDNLSDKITLTWEEPTNNGNTVDGYKIYRDGIFIQDVDSSTLTFDDVGLNLFTVYTYYIKAYHVFDNIEYLSESSSYKNGMMATLPNPPINFSASDGISSESIVCSWDSSTGAISYNVKINDNGTWKIIGYKVLSPFVYRTIPDSEFEFKVTAVNSVGESIDSNIDVGSTSARAGEIFFKPENGNYSYTFKVPNKVTKIEIYMSGAGGSGAIGEADDYHSGGGYAGEYKNIIIDVVPNENWDINLGAGGKASDYLIPKDGVEGGVTTITKATDPTIQYVCRGGQGGKVRYAGYKGQGAYLDSPLYSDTYNLETRFYDGMHSQRPGLISCYGGQASNFGHGGSRSGQLTGYGAGGSAISKHIENTTTGEIYHEVYDSQGFNVGGDGVILIRWIDASQEDDPDSITSPSLTTDGKSLYNMSSYIEFNPHVIAYPKDYENDIYDIENYENIENTTERFDVNEISLIRKKIKEKRDK